MHSNLASHPNPCRSRREKIAKPWPLPDAAALSSMQGPPRSGNSSAQTSASLHPSRSASLAVPPIHEGHGRPRSVRKSCRLRWKHLSTGSHRGDLQKGNVYASWCQSPSTRAQKCRFCARKARKQGFQTQIKHKKPDFVLGKRGNWHREA